MTAVCDQLYPPDQVCRVTFEAQLDTKSVLNHFQNSVQHNATNKSEPENCLVDCFLNFVPGNNVMMMMIS